MRVELVLLSLVKAGMETITVELAVRLKERGHEVGVTCIHELGPLQDRLSKAGVGVSLVRVPGLLPNLLTGRLTRHFRTIAPDIVHSHTGGWLKVALAAKRAGVPGVIHTIHGLEHAARLRDRSLMYAGSLFTDAITTVSDSLRLHMTAHVGIPEWKVRTVLNGVDEVHFSPDGRVNDLRERLGLGDTAVLIGVVARLSPIKDHRTLIDAFGLIRRRRPDAHLLLIGEGELESEIRGIVHAQGMESQVHFLGSVEDTAPVYRELDIFVLSSLNEGTSMSILEALASGLPIVATRVGGTPNLIQDGVQGLLVPAASPNALAVALERLTCDPALRHKMGRAARNRAVAKLTISEMVDSYDALYHQVA